MERLVYGTRINGRWCFVVNSTAALTRCEGETTCMDAECACGENAMRLARHRWPSGADWCLICQGCGQHYLVNLMPARQCGSGTFAEWLAEMAG